MRTAREIPALTVCYKGFEPWQVGAE
jgi:hypothetical protein